MQILNVNEEILPYHGGTQATLMAVLTRGTHEIESDHAVYVGVVFLGGNQGKELRENAREIQREDAIQWVAYHGEKQSYAGALRYFPCLAEKDYRR